MEVIVHRHQQDTIVLALSSMEDPLVKTVKQNLKNNKYPKSF